MERRKQIDAVKLNGRGRVGYRLTCEGQEFTLVRSVPRPERLYPVNEKLEAAEVAGFKWFTDEGGELRGVRV
ncbi:hypothetical protein EP7_004345 [Isosphaeraceae bacterium EP7]